MAGRHEGLFALQDKKEPRQAGAPHGRRYVTPGQGTRLPIRPFSRQCPLDSKGPDRICAHFACLVALDQSGFAGARLLTPKATAEFLESRRRYDSDAPGAVAEWLGRGLQSLVQRFESAPRLYIPRRTDRFAGDARRLPWRLPARQPLQPTRLPHRQGRKRSSWTVPLRLPGNSGWSEFRGSFADRHGRKRPHCPRRRSSHSLSPPRIRSSCWGLTAE
jgi:hypothetical protein